MKKLFIKSWPFIFIALIVVYFFLPSIAAGRIPIPGDSLLGLYHPWRDNSFAGYSKEHFPTKNALITDPILQTYPWRYLVIENIKNLNIPQWNPYSFLGQPLMANVQSATFQIFNLLFFFLPFNVAWTLQIIFPLVLSAIFAYLFLRSQGISKIAAVYGGLLIPFSGFFVAWALWGTIITTAIWLPLILFLVDSLFKKISWKKFIVLVFAFFQVLVSGHIQTALYILLAVTILLFLALLKKRSIFATILIVFGLTVGLLLAAPQLLPTLELSNLSNRSSDQNFYAGRQDWFIPPQNLIQLIAPDFFGNPTTNNYWGIWNYAEFVSFIGVIPLFFALFALLKLEKKYLFLPILLFSSLLLGIQNPISKLPYTLNVPFLSSFQPSRIIFLIDFSLAALSAVGLNSFLKNQNKKIMFLPVAIILFVASVFYAFIKLNPQLFNVASESVLIARRNLVVPLLSVFTLIIVLLASFKLNKKLILSIIFILTILELFRFWEKFTPFTQASLIYPSTSTTTFLQNQQKPFRILSTDRRLMTPNSQTFNKIESVSGYDPLYLKNYANFVSAWESGVSQEKPQFNRIVTPQKYNSQFANLANVKFILSFDEITSPDYQKVHEEGITKTYLNKNYLNRAFFIDQVIKKESNQEVLSAIQNSAIELNKIAYSSDFEFKGGDSTGVATFSNYSDQKMNLITSSSKDSALVITNTFYPGWNAYIDGKQTVIHNVDSIFQSIIVPAGDHDIEIKFESRLFATGIYIALIGMLLAILSSTYLWHKKYL